MNTTDKAMTLSSDIIKVLEVLKKLPIKETAEDSYDRISCAKEIIEALRESSSPNGMRWAKASEEVPELWPAHGTASKLLNLRIHGKFPKVGRYTFGAGKESFEIWKGDKLETVFDKESFHLIEYLDESSSPVDRHSELPD